MTTFTMAKKWVPNGCELTVKKETASKFICELKMGNEKAVIDIYKTTAPGRITQYIKAALQAECLAFTVECRIGIK